MPLVVALPPGVRHLTMGLGCADAMSGMSWTEIVDVTCNRSLVGLRSIAVLMLDWDTDAWEAGHTDRPESDEFVADWQNLPTKSSARARNQLSAYVLRP